MGSGESLRWLPWSSDGTTVTAKANREAWAADESASASQEVE